MNTRAPPHSQEPQVARGQHGRGRQAETPAEIPPKGWKDVIWRALREFRDDQIANVARGVAFALVLALFPAMAAFVAIFGMFGDIDTARAQLQGLSGMAPGPALDFVTGEMERIADQTRATLSLTFALSVLLSIWSANVGMKSLFAGLNIAYDEKEKRGFIRVNLITLAFTFGALVFLTIAMGTVVAIPRVLGWLGLEALVGQMALLRWPLLLVLTMIALALVYRFGPSREDPRWRWVSQGSIAASLLWVGGSLLFSWYLSRFADFSATYGSLGAVFAFMIWLWLSSAVVLFGAEINSEAERQTLKDSTTGQPEPLGDRGAVAADTIGHAKTDSMLPGFVRGWLK